MKYVQSLSLQFSTLLQVALCISSNNDSIGRCCSWIYVDVAFETMAPIWDRMGFQDDPVCLLDGPRGKPVSCLSLFSEFICLSRSNKQPFPRSAYTLTAAWRRIIVETFLFLISYFLVNSLIWWIHAVSWRMSWRRDVVWLHRCILARRSTSLISWGSQCCRLKVVRYRSLNCWMISTVCSTTPYHVMTSTRSVALYGRCFLYHFYSAVFCDI